MFKKIMVLFMSLVMVVSSVLPVAAADINPPAPEDKPAQTSPTPSQEPVTEQSVTPFKLGGGDKDNVEDGVAKEKVEKIVLNFNPGETGFEGEALETVTFTLSNGMSAVAPDVKDVVESDGFVSKSFLNWQCPTDGNRAYILEPGEALNFEALELKVRKASMTPKKELVFELHPVFQDNVPDRKVSFTLDAAQGKWEDGTSAAVSLAIADGKTVNAPTPVPVQENTKFLHWQGVDAQGQAIEGMTLNAGEAISYGQLDGVYEDKDRTYVQGYVAVFGEKKFEIKSISVDFDPSPAAFVGAGNNAQTLYRGDTKKTRIPSADGIKDKDRFLTHVFVEWVYEAEGKRITLSYGQDETMSFDLLERKLQESGMTLEEEMTLNFKATFKPVERRRMFTFVLDASRGRYEDTKKPGSRSEHVSAAHSFVTPGVIPTNPKQVFSHWQGLNEQDHNKPIEGLIFRPGELITYERMDAAMQGMRGDTFVQFRPVFEDKMTINVEFQFNGKKIMSAKLEVPKGSASVVNEQLLGLSGKLPPKMGLDKSIESYPIKNNSVVIVPLIQVRDITVFFKDEDLQVVETRVIEDVPLTQTTLKVAPPENYELLYDEPEHLLMSKDTVDIYVSLKTQIITVNLMDGSQQVGEPLTVELPITEITLSGKTISGNANMPYDYVLVNPEAEYSVVDGSIRVPVRERTRIFTVFFVDETGRTVGVQKFNDLKVSVPSVTVTAPENYELVGSATIPLQKTDRDAHVQVRVKTRTVTITFTVGEMTLGQPVTSEVSVLVSELNAEMLNPLLPERYELVDPEATYAIGEGAVEVPLQKKPRDITVYFMHGEDVVHQYVEEDVAPDAKSITVVAPEGYKLIGTDGVVWINPDNDTVYVDVGYITDSIYVSFTDNDGYFSPLYTQEFPILRHDISIAELEAMNVFVPEYCELADPTVQLYPIENGVVRIPVKTQTREILVHFIDADKAVVEDRVIENVKYVDSTLPLEAPQFYELVQEDDFAEITPNTNELTVVVKKQMVKVTLQFVEGDKTVGDPVTLELFVGQQSLTKKDIEALKIQLPANYQFADEENFPIENGVIKVNVKNVAPVNPKPVDPSKPKTGDESNIGAFALLAATSGAAAAALLLKKRKED